MSGTERPARIELMDALRGLAVCLMVLHHFLYNLCAFLGAATSSAARRRWRSLSALRS